MGRKILELPGGYAAHKFELMALFRKLPMDTTLIRADYDFPRDSTMLIFQSSEFPENAEGETYPTLRIQITRQEVAREMAIESGLQSQACTCDIAYTGEKKHKDFCPLSKS